MLPSLLKRKSAQTHSPTKKPKTELEREDNEDTTKANFEFEGDANEDSNGVTTAI
jgi:hypothetical protein